MIDSFEGFLLINLKDGGLLVLMPRLLLILIVVNTFLLLQDLLVHVVAVEVAHDPVHSRLNEVPAPGNARTQIFVHVGNLNYNNRS